MLSFIAKFLAALNANSRPGEIGAAAAFGFMLALIPGGNLLWFALFILVFLLKVHLATALLVAPVASVSASVAVLQAPIRSVAGAVLLDLTRQGLVLGEAESAKRDEAEAAAAAKAEKEKIEGLRESMRRAVELGLLGPR